MSATGTPGSDGTGAAGAGRSLQRTLALGHSRGRAGSLVGGQLGPHRPDAFFEIGDRAVVVDDVVRARPLQLRRHLRRDHLHRLRLGQLPLVHQALEPTGTRRVDEDDLVEAIDEPRLEEQGNVTDHDAVAPLARLLDEHRTLTLDLRMHELVQRLELLGVVEDDAAQGWPVDLFVRTQYRRPPAMYD